MWSSFPATAPINACANRWSFATMMSHVAIRDGLMAIRHAYPQREGAHLVDGVSIRRKPPRQPRRTPRKDAAILITFGPLGESGTAICAAMRKMDPFASTAVLSPAILQSAPTDWTGAIPAQFQPILTVWPRIAARLAHQGIYHDIRIPC